MRSMLRDGCCGEFPLGAVLAPWMVAGMQEGALQTHVEQYGSPLNIIATEPMAENIARLNGVASQRELDFKVFFARKANKCLSFVDQAIKSNIGVDTASENEVRQCLERAVDSDDILCTAAVKSRSLIDLCITNGVCIAVDNADELDAVKHRASHHGACATIAIRLGGFQHRGNKLPTRFGVDVDRDQGIVTQLNTDALRVAGVQFHLDGYDADQRVSAIGECLNWIAALRKAGHAPHFLDMGGGFPICYLEERNQWESFWQAHESALLGERSSVTYRGHGLGLINADGKIVGQRRSYPYFQQPTRDVWLASVLDSDWKGRSIADHLRNADLQLRCEPGRSLLEGCGMTVARVEFRKQNADGDWLIGLAMNRTQCRTSSDDFLVDPILLPSDPTVFDSMSGFLVGAYCTESELLSLRRLNFPRGVRRGDLIVFPNTAGYFMHFLESRSHQFPLAQNVVMRSNMTMQLDPIDDQVRHTQPIESTATP